MTIRVAINGFGRIGRNILRAKYESDKYQDIQIVAINDLGDSNINAHLLIHDTVHGKFNTPVEVRHDKIIIDNSDEILVTSERDPNNLPWGKLKVDVVYECTGIFVSKDKAGGHIKAGAKKVIISAPGKEVDNTVVYGVNHDTLTDQHTVRSNASCTTNCLATVIKNIHKHLDITNGLMTTIHAYTNDQVLTDVYHTDLRRARSATQSMIPTKTGAAAAVGQKYLPKAQTGGVVRETGMAVVHKGETIAGTQFGGRESNKLLKQMIEQNATLMNRLTNRVGDLALSS